MRRQTIERANTTSNKASNGDEVFSSENVLEHWRPGDRVLDDVFYGAVGLTVPPDLAERDHVGAHGSQVHADNGTRQEVSQVDDAQASKGACGRRR